MFENCNFLTEVTQIGTLKEEEFTLAFGIRVLDDHGEESTVAGSTMVAGAYHWWLPTSSHRSGIRSRGKRRSSVELSTSGPTSQRSASASSVPGSQRSTIPKATSPSGTKCSIRGTCGDILHMTRNHLHSLISTFADP